MKKILPVIFALCAFAAAAQTSALKVSYNYHYFTARGYEVERPMILVADATKSKFYNPMTNMIDSLNSTPEGRAKYKAMRPTSIKGSDIGKYPTRWEKMYIEKNHTDSITKAYDTLGEDERYYCSEQLGGFEWNISDSTQNILGYECLMAEADFRGRHWTVFFTPEIPLAEGPWKLCGLPGLILEARESCGQYSFKADGIENINGPVPPVYEENLYEPMDRIELLKFKRNIAENFGSFITAQTSAKNLRPSQFKSLELKADLDYLETDYR